MVCGSRRTAAETVCTSPADQVPETSGREVGVVTLPYSRMAETRDDFSAGCRLGNADRPEGKYAASHLQLPDPVAGPQNYQWTLTEVSRITHSPFGDAASPLPAPKQFAIAAESHLLSGTVDDRQITGMIFDENQSLFQTVLSSESARRLLTGSFIGNESRLADLSYQKEEHTISAPASGNCERSSPALSGSYRYLELYICPSDQNLR